MSGAVNDGPQQDQADGQYIADKNASVALEKEGTDRHGKSD